MLAIKHIITLITLIGTIIYVYLSHIRSEIIASVLLVLCVLYIIVFGNINTKNEETKECLLGDTRLLEGILYGGCIDIWHIYHFVFWILIGILAPGRVLLAFLLSLGWETCEHFVFKTLGKCNQTFCGRIEDIVLNITGYTLGSFIAFKL